jgi:hypothetical protein
MKNRKCLFLLISVSFLVVLVLPGLAKNDRAQGAEGKSVVQEEPAVPVKDKFSEEKREFESKAKEELDKIDKKMDELELKLKKAGSKAKEEAKESLRELKTKRIELKNDMKRLERSGRRTWEAAKWKAEKAMNDLKEAYDKARDKIMSE